MTDPDNQRVYCPIVGCNTKISIRLLDFHLEAHYPNDSPRRSSLRELALASLSLPSNSNGIKVKKVKSPARRERNSVGGGRLPFASHVNSDGEKEQLQRAQFE